MEIERMPKEELRERLNTPETIVIDVRRDQKEAESKITGSRLHDPDQVTSWAGDYPKDRFLVLYCS